jgi:hypothetical protein
MPWPPGIRKTRKGAKYQSKPEVRSPSAARLPDTIATRDAFLSAVKDQSLRMHSRVTVLMLAKSTPTGSSGNIVLDRIERQQDQTMKP